MRKKSAAKFLISATFVVAASAFMALAISQIYAASSLKRSENGDKIFDVRPVQQAYTSLENIKGVKTLSGDSGCYVVWNADRAEVYRAGWTEGQTFEATLIWGQDFVEPIRDIVPLENGESCFIAYTKNTHAIYKADWFRNY